MKQQADQEFFAMRRIVQILKELPHDTRKRVFAYVSDRVQNGDKPEDAPAQAALPLGQ